MCTVTWWMSPDGSGYELFFNRDERRSRQPAEPPKLFHRLAVNYLAPTDTDYRGTWLLVNDRGVTLALVNHYPQEPQPPKTPARSRGLLARDLADSESIAEIRERLGRARLHHYSPMFIFAFERGEAPVKWTWDSRNLLEEPAAEPLPFFTSSSFRSEDIRRHRRKLFAENWADKGRLDPRSLSEFHLHRETEQPAFGILMDRPNARTVSLSHIVVGPGAEAVFAYQSRQPEDGTLPNAPLVSRLELVNSRSSEAAL